MFELQIIADFESNKSLRLFHRELNAAEYTTCFEVSEIDVFFPKNQNYLSVGTVLDKNPFTVLSLHELQVHEKKHKLEIDEKLRVSEYLTHEIFDKVKSFERILESDAPTLNSLVKIQKIVLQKSAVLEIYVRNLFDGTRKFQEKMLAVLATKGDSSTLAIPKLDLIRRKISGLMNLQKQISDRFLLIQKNVDTSKFLEITQVSFDMLDDMMTKLLKLVDSDKFAGFVDQVDQVVDFLGDFKVDEVYEKAGKVILMSKNQSVSEGYITVGLVGVLGICILGASEIVRRKIAKAKEE